MTDPLRWTILWRENNRLDGRREFFMWDPGTAGPYLFRTRREAREEIKKRWGYIARRPDLRKEPHGWKMPVPMKVTVHLYPQERSTP